MTASEKVNVAVNGVRSLIFGGTPPIASVGTVPSHVAVATTFCAGPVFTPSVAVSLRTVTVTFVFPSGVTSSVYVVPLVLANGPLRPPTTSTSPITNSLTSSEKVKVA